MRRSKTIKIAAALTMATFGLSSPASAAARAASSADAAVLSPWVALSALGSASSSAAVCGASTAAASSSVAQGAAAPGCVLPVMDAPPPVVQPTPEPIAAVAPVERGFSVLPLLLGLAGVAAIAALLLSGGDGDDDVDIEPEPVTQP